MRQRRETGWAVVRQRTRLYVNRAAVCEHRHVNCAVVCKHQIVRCVSIRPCACVEASGCVFVLRYVVVIIEHSAGCLPALCCGAQVSDCIISRCAVACEHQAGWQCCGMRASDCVCSCAAVCKHQAGSCAAVCMHHQVPWSSCAAVRRHQKSVCLCCGLCKHQAV